MNRIWLALIAPAVLSPLAGYATDASASAAQVASGMGSFSAPSSVMTFQHPSDTDSGPVPAKLDQSIRLTSHTPPASTQSRSSIASRGMLDVRRRMLSTASVLKLYDLFLMALVLLSLAAFQLRRMQDSLHRPFADR